MTQPVATFDNVTKAIDQLLKAGRKPTLDAIQAIVGGNKATIAREREKIRVEGREAVILPSEKDVQTVLPQVEKILRSVGAQMEKLSAAYRADLSNAIAEERARSRADIEFATKTLVDQNDRLMLDNAELVAELEIAEAKLQSVLALGPQVEELLKHFAKRDIADESKRFEPAMGQLANADAAKSASGGGVSSNSAPENKVCLEPYLIRPMRHSSCEDKVIANGGPPVEALLALMGGSKPMTSPG
jgi:hypothetical protein